MINKLLFVIALTSILDVSIIDSKTRAGRSWVLVNDCAVEVNTSDIQYQPSLVIKKINDFCHLNLDKLNVGQE